MAKKRARRKPAQARSSGSARPAGRKTTGNPRKDKGSARKAASTKSPGKTRTPQSRRATRQRPQVGAGTIVAGPVRPGAAGAVGPVGEITPHLPFAIRNHGNFFDADRPGQPVVRPDDLLALRLELRNLTVRPGSPPRLRKTGSGTAYLVLHFPPQAITEETFFETRPPGTTDPKRPDGSDDKPSPAGSDPLTGPPIRARISGESRLAFAVPDGFDIEYSLESILAAVEELALSVAPNALPPGSGRPLIDVTDIFVSDISRLSARRRAALTSFALRNIRLAAIEGDMTTVALRQATGGSGLAAVRPEFQIIDVGVAPGLATRPRIPPRPAAPGAQHTAIELPWRLILSPHKDERWRHAKKALPAPSGHTELWHSRLVATNGTEPIIEPPQSDPQRSVRAVWALTGEGSPKPMQSAFPVASDLPAPNTSPFRMPLDDFDRFQITHLSSNFSVSNYTPDAVGTNLLMLSALGGWLDSRGAWDPPGLSVEEWVHRATMGRDQFVRVVYKGFLFPFGHRVALVKVSERKFHNGARDADGTPTIEQVAGNTAYLRQRLFIIVRERERKYADPQLKDIAGTKSLHRQFPFTSIRIVTAVTPNLDKPDSPASRIQIGPDADQRMFWPCVNGQPFEFQCVGTDLDGRSVKFGLPLIFMDNTKASPRTKKGNKLVPAWDAAEDNALVALAAWREPSRSSRRVANTKQQRVAMAASLKAGDTSMQADAVSFDAFVEKGNGQLRTYSNGLMRPVFYPSVDTTRVRIPALAQLTGSGATNTVTWNAHYLKQGFANNQGEVFVDVVSEPGMAKLDFSSQGDKSGGFVQPNLKPSAISRLTGPVTGNVTNFINGTLNGADAFPSSMSDLPLPLLFGCIPLGEVIEAVTNLAGKPEQVPKFASEASTQVESFINGLTRLFEFVSQLADQPGRLADAAVAVAKSTLQDLLDQAASYPNSLVGDVKARITQLTTALNQIVAQVAPLFDKTIDTAPALPGLAGALANAQTAAGQLRTAANASVGGVSMPAGFRQSVLQVANTVDTLVADIGTITTLLTQGKALFTALDAIVGQPDQLGDLLSNPAALATKLEAIANALGPIRATIAGNRLLDGAPGQAILDAIDVVLEVLDAADQLLDLLEMLTGDELTIRFDWNPPIANWALPGADPNTEALFRANDKRGFLVAVEAKVKKNGQSAPKIGVVCSLKSFDLVLIAPASFIELNFEKIEFRIDSAAKMDVDVLLSDIKFVGPLSFVETLRDLIPLDGFSDPPYLDITPQGIDSGFSLALPNISIGVFNLSNLSLGAGFTVPFIGQPLSVRFNFCTREQPFNLSVSMFGGGGFFGITLDPHGIQILEASFEFGASISVDFGVASGGVYVMAGIYFRMEKDACSLTGYFRLGGHVDVLGLITASLELYLELRYEFESGKCAGKATLTIEVEVFVFSGSVTITCERKFAGSNGDPSFRDLMGPNPALALPQELATIDDTTDYAWRAYCEAFAA